MAALLPSTAHAGGGCPDRAESLEAFAGCMVVMPGNTGTMYRGTLATLKGNAHADVMNAMQMQPVVPPQAVPGGYVPYYAAYSPILPSMVSIAASKAYRNNPHSTYWTWWAVNNAIGYPYY